MQNTELLAVQMQDVTDSFIQSDTEQELQGVNVKEKKSYPCIFVFEGQHRHLQNWVKSHKTWAVFFNFKYLNLF